MDIFVSILVFFSNATWLRVSFLLESVACVNRNADLTFIYIDYASIVLVYKVDYHSAINWKPSFITSQNVNRCLAYLKGDWTSVSFDLNMTLPLLLSGYRRMLVTFTDDCVCYHTSPVPMELFIRYSYCNNILLTAPVHHDDRAKLGYSTANRDYRGMNNLKIIIVGRKCSFVWCQAESSLLGRISILYR
jgi:hypothetical protein